MIQYKICNAPDVYRKQSQQCDDAMLEVKHVKCVSLMLSADCLTTILFKAYRTSLAFMLLLLLHGINRCVKYKATEVNVK